ncbi:hypothetical protein GIB67_007942 [Kingdonia uniflora]|uniref:Uncharacterized protein n=1 Tax=Kingdonia uniflora TaxID=39325 RepID=A0A7J7LX96_9MAGN|nr:hypothetical protein GIB67_007942 [Kingdonia uniflora]
MVIYKWPTSVIKEGERILRNFLWSGEPDSKKACVVAWDKVCKPLKEGGINLRRLKEINQSLMMKLTWNFLNPKDEWSEFMRAKFVVKSGSFSTITKGSSIWAGVRGALEDVHAHSGWVIGDGACIDLWRDNWCSSFSKDMINNDDIPWTDLHAKDKSDLARSQQKNIRRADLHFRQDMVTSIHANWFCARCLNTSKPVGEGMKDQLDRHLVPAINDDRGSIVQSISSVQSPASFSVFQKTTSLLHFSIHVICPHLRNNNAVRSHPIPLQQSNWCGFHNILCRRVIAKQKWILAKVQKCTNGEDVQKAKVNELKLYRLKAKKKMTSPNPEVRISYASLHIIINAMLILSEYVVSPCLTFLWAKRKEEWLIEKLKKFDIPMPPPETYDPEILTNEEKFYLKRIGEKKKNYVPLGRRGVFGGVVLICISIGRNMKL